MSSLIEGLRAFCVGWTGAEVTTRCRHRAYVARISVSDLAQLQADLPADVLQDALELFNHSCEWHRSTTHGHYVQWDRGGSTRSGKLTAADAAATEEPPTCDDWEPSTLIVAFHTLDDAMVWALMTQRVLARAEWPAALEQSEASRSVHHREPSGERPWSRALAGLRATVAVNGQRFDAIRHGEARRRRFRCACSPRLFASSCIAIGLT